MGWEYVQAMPCANYALYMGAGECRIAGMQECGIAGFQDLTNSSYYGTGKVKAGPVVPHILLYLCIICLKTP